MSEQPEHDSGEPDGPPVPDLESILRMSQGITPDLETGIDALAALQARWMRAWLETGTFSREECFKLVQILVAVSAGAGRSLTLSWAGQRRRKYRSQGHNLCSGDVMAQPEPPVSRTETELRQLRAEITALRKLVADSRLQTQLVHLRLLRMAPVRHGWLRFAIKDLETNPRTQYKVHLWGAVYWLVNFPLITLLFFFEPTLWLKLGIFITLIYSIYANFATDYGSMSAAMASFGDHPMPELPVEQYVSVPEMPDA